MSENTDSEKILIVDDDDLFRETLLQNLEDDGYAVAEADGGTAALDLLRNGPAPDLVILDWNMPGMTGLELLKAMRADGIGTAVLFLTGHNDQLYEESALELGASDFVDKSRSYSILTSRIRLALGAANPQDEHAAGNGDAGDIEIGPLTLRESSKRAIWRETEVGLTVSEFEIVYLLASKPGTDVRFRDIYDVVHGKGFWAGHGEDGFRTNVRTFIKRIRKKFRDIDGEFDAIENYPGFGYRWRANEPG